MRHPEVYAREPFAPPLRPDPRRASGSASVAEHDQRRLITAQAPAA